MTEQNVYTIAGQMLKERMINDYDTDVQIVSINPLEKKYIFPNGDLFLFINAFSDNPLNGKMVSADNALRINSKTMSTKMFKHQMFKHVIMIQNFDALEDLNIEMLRITPIS